MSEQKTKKKRIDPAVDWFLGHCHMRKHPAKTTIITAGEVADTLYYILRGTVSVYIKDEETKEMILTNLSQGDFFGEAGLFTDEPTRTAFIRTKVACDIAEISYKKFEQLVHMNPDILMYLAGQLSARLQHTSQQVTNLTFLDVTGRIAQALLNLTNMPEAMSHPKGIQIKITRQEIGQMVGCSRETVGRILRMLEDQDLISAHGKTVVVYHKALMAGGPIITGKSDKPKVKKPRTTRKKTTKNIEKTKASETAVTETTSEAA